MRRQWDKAEAGWAAAKTERDAFRKAADEANAAAVTATVKKRALKRHRNELLRKNGELTAEKAALDAQLGVQKAELEEAHRAAADLRAQLYGAALRAFEAPEPTSSSGRQHAADIDADDGHVSDAESGRHGPPASRGTGLLTLATTPARPKALPAPPEPMDTMDVADEASPPRHSSSTHPASEASPPPASAGSSEEPAPPPAPKLSNYEICDVLLQLAADSRNRDRHEQARRFEAAVRSIFASANQLANQLGQLQSGQVARSHVRDFGTHVAQAVRTLFDRGQVDRDEKGFWPREGAAERVKEYVRRAEKKEKEDAERAKVEKAAEKAAKNKKKRAGSGERDGLDAESDDEDEEERASKRPRRERAAKSRKEPLGNGNGGAGDDSEDGEEEGSEAGDEYA
ncbi:hypothetical protein DFJ74DRAFT_696330 [Hyaloraphidium curvatum]|nr:hypothetical protein DFJ74DRAFT_696330 [Hyaloraphidium curvatum]